MLLRSLSLRTASALMTSALALSAAACSSGTPSTSQPLVTDVDHTIVKRQSIGNCWIYAQATWLESVLKVQTGEELDVSESYMTWWHWYDQIVGSSSIREIQTGGFWNTSANIILEHGFVLEGEFIEDEDGVEMSLRQAEALEYINEQLKPGGKLGKKALRKAWRVRRELDKAFGVKMADAEDLARDPADVIVGEQDDGSELTLDQALGGSTGKRWQYVSFPRVWGEDAEPTAAQQAARKQLIRRVLKALNDKQPVVMSFMVDFNALDVTDATFKAATLRDAGAPGSQGGHMVVLEDYTVANAPGFGDIGEGEVSEEMKAAALDGELRTLVAKNSWGKDRPDRGLTDGYTRFDTEYLFSQLAWKDDEAGTSVSYFTTLTDFILPPGY